MPFCGSCGAPVEGSFCAKCGASVGAPPPPAGAYAPPPPPPPPGNYAPPPPAGGYQPPMPGAYQPQAGAPMAENVACALCYILGLVTGILFLVLAPYNQNRTIRFHAFQSIFLHIFAIVCWIVISILTTILMGMSYSLGFGFVGFGIHSLLGLGFFILWLYVIVSAYQGKTVVLPVIGHLAQQQA